jgi:hypothetical protein
MDTTSLNHADFEAVRRAFQDMRETPWRGTVPTPQCRYLDDPPGKALALAYAQEHLRQESASGPRIPVFIAEVPVTPTNRTEGYLPMALLKQLGGPQAERRESAYEKTMRLEFLLRKYEVELVILTDVHRLMTPGGKRLLEHEVDWIEWVFKSEIGTIPLVLVGEPRMMERMAAHNQKLEGIIGYIPLPGGDTPDTATRAVS